MTRQRRLRVALYSPGMVGIGHMRRNLLIARALVQSAWEPIVLMIAEAREANVLTLPPGVDCLTLPALRKEYDGECLPRYLQVSLEEVVKLRMNVIGATLKSFQPDVLLVDHLPRGALGELGPSLADLRRTGHTRCILGLRDVLEEPARVRQDWAECANEDALRAFYDAVWIYGAPAVFDAVREYDFSPDVAAMVRFAGYLNYRSAPGGVEEDHVEFQAAQPNHAEPLVLCSVGGGQDGAKLAETFAQADLPHGSTGVILTGPFMPADAQTRLRRYAERKPNLRILGFVPNPDSLLRHANRVVAMGGYNTVYEILSFEKHALIIPRSKPRHEQRIRAERLERLGLIEVLDPEKVTPAALSAWLARDLGPSPRPQSVIDMNGTRRLPELLQEVLALRPNRKGPHGREVQHAIA
jgi:predicted glycosyltransferase